MKNIVLILGFLFLSFSTIGQTLIKDKNGKNVDIVAEIKETNQPVLVCFFATWCKPCLKELNAINNIYDEFLKYDVKIIAIAVDNSRSINSVFPLVNSMGLEFDVYIDNDAEFKREMNVNNIPHSFLYYNKKVVYQHQSYLEGDEIIILEKVKKLK
jgi:thiol-disulfide isomerase/thioredoxin